MSRQVWILRHGEAVPHGSRASDDDRELTPRGERQAEAAGAALARLGVEVAACYTSPKVRARDTARLCCRSLGVEPETVAALRSDFGTEDLSDLVLRHDEQEPILLVGHEPDLSQVVHDLTGARVDFKKGGVAAIALDGARGELVALLRPRELARIAVAPPPAG